MKKLWISVLLLAITIGGVYFFIKFNPPLEIGTLASSEDDKLFTQLSHLENRPCFRSIKALRTINFVA